MANIQGTPGSNQLTGTFLDDQIYGLAGRDFLYGLNGNDYLYGGADDDSLNGGNGRDYLQGDGGADILFGGPGTDTAVFNGNYSDYLITKIGNNPTTVQDLNGLNGIEGVDTVWFDVERIQFNDKVVFLVPNQAPVAADNNATTNEDTAVSVGSVLANDTDGDLDPLSVSAVNGSAGAVGSTTALASGALVTMQADGTYVYNPNGKFEHLQVGGTAQDSFTYTVSDGFGGFDDATVTVTIQGVNDAPVAIDDTAATNEDTAVNVGSVLANDTDVEADALSVSAVNGSAAAVGSATALASGALVTMQANGAYLYNPNGNFEHLQVGGTAQDSFTYTVSDGFAGFDTATVTVTIQGVNDAPVAIDDTAATNEDTAVNVGSVLANDTDVEADALSVSAVNSSAAAVGSATALASGALVTMQANGAYLYNPNGKFEHLQVGGTAQDSFTYTVSDGFGGFDDATVTVTIQGVNDAPVAIDDTAATNEDASVNVSSVLGNDTDVEADALSVSAVNGSAGAVGSTIALASGALVTMQANGTYVYDPNGQFESLSAGQTAQDSFTYTVSDGFGGFDTATVTVTIQGVNDFSVLNFDDIPVTNGGSAAIPAGYQGFNWTNAQLFDPANDNPIRVLTAAGLGFTPDSGENIVRSTGSPLEIRQSDGSNFDFISAFFSSATDNNQITITAYDDSNAVKGTFTFEVDEGSLFIGSLFPPAPPDVDNNFPRTIDLSSVAGFTDVDKVTITGTATFGFDDFAFNA